MQQYRGRLPYMAPRENKLTIVLTDEEKRWLEVLAEADSRTQSAWVRLAIKDAYAALDAKHKKVEEHLKKKPKR